MAGFYTKITPKSDRLLAHLRLPLASAILLLDLLPVPVPADEAALSPNEIRTALIGNTIHGIGEESGWFFAIYYLPDGTVSGRSAPSETDANFWFDKGRWEITHEEGYCLTWNFWKRGIRRCMDMIPKDGRYEFRTKDGQLQSVTDLLPGNPDGL
jgi:hypothetical protein